jgi:hypothetical protein
VVEWTASVSIDADPERAAAMNFVAATSTLPINAARTVRVESDAMFEGRRTADRDRQDFVPRLVRVMSGRAARPM